MGIKENYARIWKDIEDACRGSGRKAEEIGLLAVTKKRGIEEIKEALSCGIACIGESQLQEAVEKLPLLKGVKKHMIGHVQTNKVKGIIDMFDVIESVDSLKLAKEIDKSAKEKGKTVECYIEVNIADEESKFGTNYDDVERLYKEALKLTNIKVTGLMCIAPLVEAEETRPYFRKMKILKDKLGLKKLSMGMSNDYVVAIEEGSTEIRIGTALFM